MGKGRELSSPDRAPPHHDPAGGFRNPWPTALITEEGGFLRWQRERRAAQLPANPPLDSLPRASPRILRTRDPAELRVTWVGHASFLLQIGGFNLLTDPQWSRRASPFRFLGPARFSSPGIDWEDLPEIDGVLISHDHYDHLDSPTVRRLRQRFGDGVRWYTPLGYRRWLARRGVEQVEEFDWWDETDLSSEIGSVRITAAPCQHWTSRGLWDRGRRLWASWGVRGSDGTLLYFGGDSGYFPGFQEIGERLGPPDIALLPIGAYAPRWFMRPMHMNPEDAVQAYRDLGSTGVAIGMHWGTWRLTDEDPREPPLRMREAWKAADLPESNLHLLPIGGTWRRADAGL